VHADVSLSAIKEHAIADGQTGRRKHSAGVRSVVGRDAGSLIVDRIEWLLASGGVG